MIESRSPIVEPNLTSAWVRAMQGAEETVPLVVTVTGIKNNVALETPEIREALDAYLVKSKLQTCATVAGTIFPSSMWNPARPRAELFARYGGMLPRIRHASTKNRRGTYFGRLTTGGRPDLCDGNQLEFIIHGYLEGTRRCSFMQASTFDPKEDHIAGRQLGFPCMQHVAFTRFTENGVEQLALTAFYATQILVERAYGNYLGLCRLGAFVAHEIGLPFTRMSCVAARARREHPLKSMPDVDAAIAAHLA